MMAPHKTACTEDIFSQTYQDDDKLENKPPEHMWETECAWSVFRRKKCCKEKVFFSLVLYNTVLGFFMLLKKKYLMPRYKRVNSCMH